MSKHNTGDDHSATAPSSDLINVLEAMEMQEDDDDEDEEANQGHKADHMDKKEQNGVGDDNGEEKEEIKEKPRKLPDWMRDPREVAEEQVQKSILMQAKKREFLENAAKSVGIDENTKFEDKDSRWIELDHPVAKGRVVCFDLETTGFGYEDSIIEIGAVELIDGYRTGSLFQSYAKPRGKIHPMATAAHEITDSMLLHAPPIQIVMASFLDWVGTSPLVAHNLTFDLRMLNQELDRLEMGQYVNYHPTFCTLRYWRKLFPLRTGTLDDLSASFGVSRIVNRGVHGALVDSEILAQCYARLVRL